MLAVQNWQGPGNVRLPDQGNDQTQESGDMEMIQGLLTQTQIARELGISNSRVSAMLANIEPAHEVGMAKLYPAEVLEQLRERKDRRRRA